MPKFKPNTSTAMKRSAFKMAGYTYPGTSPVKNKNEEAIKEAKKNRALEAYNKSIETKASELYLKDRSFRTGGTDFTKLDEKTKVKYRAKAQNA